MPKKLHYYFAELERAGTIQNNMLLSPLESEAALLYFKEPTALKLSKKTKMTQFSVVRDEGGKLFAIHNPVKKVGLAGGAQGIIKVAQDIKTGSRCLVKVQKIPMGKNNDALLQCQKEKFSAKKNNILYGYQLRTQKDKEHFISYMFMKELPGLPIEDGREPASSFLMLYGKTLTPGQQLTILKNLLVNFVELTHARIIHRDLHPRNILIDKDDDFKVYFVDWGSSLEMDNEGHAVGYAEHDFQKKKSVQFANGVDFLRLTDTFTELNLLGNEKIRKEVQRLVKACGNLKANYNHINVQPLIDLVNAALSDLMRVNVALAKTP